MERKDDFQEYNYEYDQKYYHEYSHEKRDNGLEFGGVVAAALIGSAVAIAVAVGIGICVAKKKKGRLFKNITSFVADSDDIDEIINGTGVDDLEAVNIVDDPDEIDFTPED